MAYSLHFLRVNEILVFFFQVFFLLGNLNFLLVLREAFFNHFVLLFYSGSSFSVFIAQR